MSPGERILAHVTCLGCGCACDDIQVTVRDGRIVETLNACALGARWFGDGQVPWRAMVGGRESTLEAALDATAALLASAGKPLIYLAPDLSCEAQREAVSLADLLRATIDSVTSDTILEAVLAGQERGRATATLGEIRNRADLLVWWGVNPELRYPRYTTRYAPDPAGLHLPAGRASRTVVAVDIGEARGPADVDRRIAISAQAERDTLTHLIALAGGEIRPGLISHDPQEIRPGLISEAAELNGLFRSARYAVIVADAEPAAGAFPHGDPVRPGLLVALAQALNAPTRCALSLLRAGGNRSGADAVLTWQTGYPVSVDFSRGYPRYRPFDGRAAVLLEERQVDAVLVLGSSALVPSNVASMMTRVPVAVAGPRASESAFADGVSAIDTGLAGVHEGDMALRMDDVPVRLRAPLDASVRIQTITQGLSERIVTRQRNAGQGPGAPVLR